jgi:hypothetical protein
VAPRLASPTMMVGHNIWIRGARGAGAGVQEIAQFWPEKLDSMRGAQGAWFGDPIFATSFTNYNF